MHALFLQEILSPKKANIPLRGTNGKIGKMQPASCVPEAKPWQLSLIYSTLHMLPNQIWVCFLYKAKSPDTRLWWRKVTFIVAHQARRTGISCSKDPNSLMALREGTFKAVWGSGLQGVWSAHVPFLDWLVSRWSFKHHQLSGFNWSRVCAFLVSSFHLVGCVLPVKTT